MHYRLIICLIHNNITSTHFECDHSWQDYNQQMQRRVRNPTSSEENQVDEERPPIRFMHREERRNAMKELLGFENITLNKQNGVNITETVGGCTKSPTNLSLDLSLSSSDEGPICSICLTEYKSTDLIFQSNICPHKFHQECVLSWLERRNNTVSEARRIILGHLERNCSGSKCRQ